jgi:osmotically-inducible protein OsmY
LRSIAAVAALLAGVGTAAAQLPGLDTRGSTSIGGSVNGAVSGVTDAAVKGRLESTLRHELEIPGVRSDVVNGVAMLRGTVASEDERDRAAEIARGVHGVTRVRNDIVVQRDAGGAGGAATSLSAAVLANLHASRTFAGRGIEVETTKDNVVRLTGEVSSEGEKALAGKIAADTAAAVEVRNELVVESRQ